MNKAEKTQKIAADKKWWQSSNFWTNVVLLLSGLFVGFPQGEATNAIAAIFALVVSGKMIYNWVKAGVKIDFAGWISNSNNKTYLAALITAIFPLFPGTVFDPLWQALQALFSQNWQGFLVAILTLVNIIWNVYRDNLAKFFAYRLTEHEE